MADEPLGCQTVPYCRRHPEQTALYQVVQQHLETYLALSREDDWGGSWVPAYVEREFRRYLECGILAYGFARARWPLELIDQLAALIPPPRRHRHRCHGVLAPNAPLRAAAIAFGREVADATGSPSPTSSSISASPGSRLLLPQRVPALLISGLHTAPQISSQTPPKPVLHVREIRTALG